MEQEEKNTTEPFNDEWLTRALRARSQSAARPGLEGRILARLAGEQESRPQRRWRWMPALALAFGLLLIVLVGHEFLRVRPRSHQDQARTPQPTREAPPLSPVAAAPKVQIAKSHGSASKRLLPARAQNSHPVVATANSLPKLEKFPAETQATEQEKLMAEMQRRQSTAVLAQYARDFHNGKDLVIENNSIPPLSPETADEKPNR
jgi:hypothetical protein